MKKLRPPYLIVTLMLVLFASSITLPYFAGRTKEQSGCSSDKEKTEKESKEKDYSGENEYKEYLSNINLFHQDGDYFSATAVQYADPGSLLLLNLYMPVLTPPPDRA